MDAKLLELTRREPRFTYEAYEFVCQAVTYTQERLGRAAENDEPPEDRHVSGAELLRGGCELALREFGLMASVVFKLWGIRSTDDFGRIVFNLINTEQLSKSDRDDPEDFREVFDLDKALTEGFEFSLGEPTRRADR